MGPGVTGRKLLTRMMMRASLADGVDELHDLSAIGFVNADEAAAGLSLAAQRANNPHGSPDGRLALAVIRVPGETVHWD